MTDKKRLAAETLSAHARTLGSARWDLAFRNSETTLVSIRYTIESPRLALCT